MTVSVGLELLDGGPGFGDGDLDVLILVDELLVLVVDDGKTLDPSQDVDDGDPGRIGRRGHEEQQADEQQRQQPFLGHGRFSSWGRRASAQVERLRLSSQKAGQSRPWMAASSRTLASSCREPAPQKLKVKGPSSKRMRRLPSLQET